MNARSSEDERPDRDPHARPRPSAERRPLAPTLYVTTAIPYVNAAPHLGFCFEILLADTLARYHRLRGSDVRFLTGTDENSLKNVRAAESLGLSTRELVERNAREYEALRETLDLSWDDFIRTSRDPRHRVGVEALWRACESSGDLYKRRYEGLYCVGCEQFYAPEELTDGVCPEHLVAPEPTAEENWFFRLSRYGDRLLALINSGELAIEPARYRREITTFIREGLRDISVSRSTARARGWGIPVPGDPGQVIYVWFDALGNYISSLGYGDGGAVPTGETGESTAGPFERYWLGGDQRCHVIGKGITRFHAVYWPAILLSAGLPLPDTLFVHAYLTVDGRKISKSLGGSPDPGAIVGDVGVDALRYFLLRHLRAGQDGDFSLPGLVRAHDEELADRLGNLLSRSVALVHRYRGGVTPAAGPLAADDKVLIEIAEGLWEHVECAFAELRLHDALLGVWELVGAANRYVDRTQPWKLARGSSPEAHGRLDTVLYGLLESLRIIALYLGPFLPQTARRIEAAIGCEDEPRTAFRERAHWGGYPAGRSLPPPGPILFPKLRGGAL